MTDGRVNIGVDESNVSFYEGKGFVTVKPTAKRTTRAKAKADNDSKDGE